MNSTTPPESRRPSTKREVAKLARERNVRFGRLAFADIFGVSRNVSIPIEELDAALDGHITFDGGSIDGFVRGEELDMLLRPDPATFAVYPWHSGSNGAEARLFQAQARDHFSPSMRQRIDLAGLYEDALKALPDTIDGLPPLSVPQACPVTLDELLAP